DKRHFRYDFKDIVSYVDPRGGLNFYLTLINKEIDTKVLFRRLKKKNIYISH
ncbi:Transcriptional regulator, GntR family/aminotransferase, partial [human gut metagenome]